MDSSVKNELIESFRKATNKLILLDYDGTLVKYEQIPENARLPKRLTEILRDLIIKPQTKVFIISGRGYNDIDKLLGHLPINIISDHGSMIKTGSHWRNMIADNNLWKKSVIPVFLQASLNCPKSFVEEKEFSIAWHYRNADYHAGSSHSKALILDLKRLAYSYNLKILNGNKVVEIINNETGKGKAVKKLIEEGQYDFILSIGDDTTDEEMFEYFLNIPNAYTVKVGTGSSFARYKLSGIDQVVSLLKQLSK
jgi:trehalose 6-phosphate synthase/phosphatase